MTLAAHGLAVCQELADQLEDSGEVTGVGMSASPSSVWMAFAGAAR
jgi:hypothetical protein